MRAAAFLTIAVSMVFYVCNRNNPYDLLSSNYVSGSKPHVAFVQRTLEGFLLDSLTIRIAWSDTAIGGGKGGIRKYYFDWNSDTLFRDSIDGTSADTFVVKKAFPQGNYTARVKAEDFDGRYSDVDSMRLTVRSSLPRIVASSAPNAVEKAVVCTLSVTAGDSGGAIRSFIWASDGTDFKDTTSAGSFQVSYADTGVKTILVKVRDNKSIESPIDTIHLSVFEKLYTVSYDGNGSTGGSVPLDNNKYGQGQSVEVLENTGALIKTGYTFVGWNTQANDSGAGYMPGANFTMGTSTVTLYAQWEVSRTYAIIYNGNGNTGGAVPTDTAHYALGQSVTTRGNTGALVKSGSTFVGWNTQANGSGIDYATGVAFTMGSNDVTLYAQWTADPTYTVTYYGNGNSSGTIPADPNNYAKGATVTVLGNSGTLARDGFTFVGWNTQADGSGTAYASGVTFTIGSANLVLYAQWTANPTYVVTYNGNGNTGGSVPIDANSYAQGQTVTTQNMGSLAKTGYAFTGWNTAVNGSGTAYAAGTTFVMGAANVILYAQWTVNLTYTVTYNGNGSTGGTVPADSARYSLGQSVTTRANTGSLVKAAFTFVGWNTLANGSGISYATGVAFTMGSSNLLLYAQWTANPTYTVSYDGNGNTSGSVPTDLNNYQAGATITAAPNTSNLAKSGFTFVGWNTLANGGGTGYAAGVTFAMASANVVLYAQWTANPTYVVTYNGNGGTGGTVPIDVNSYAQGQTVTTRSMGSLVKTGYAFTGWNTAANGSGIAYAAGATFAMGAANVILYAQWTVNLTYTVTYNGNGNTGGTIPADTGHYALGQSITTRGNTGSLVKAGFTFVGWNMQASGGGISYATGVAFMMGSANMIFYAQWTANPTFTVTYDGNGNTGGTVPTDSNNYLSGATVTVALNTGNLAKAGFAFVGWNTKTNGTGTSYAAGVTFAMVSANVILYAQWSANPTYVVTYNGNGSTGGVPIDVNNYLTGAIVTVLNPGSLARAGYAFAGWNTQTGGGTGYAVGSTFAMGTANVTLFAQWTLISTYTVTYNGNGNTGGTVPADSGRYTPGQSVTTRGNTGSLVKAGFTFIGWNTAPNGSGIGYATGTSFLMGSVNDTLYAQWTALPTYTVTYDGNGNTSGTVPAVVNNYLAGATVAVALNTGNLAKTGFAFVGWNTKTNGTGTSYAASAGVAFVMGSASVILYAQWSANPTYTVTYNGNASSYTGSVPTDANNYLTGATVIVLNSGSLARTGYTFAGWNTKASGGTGYPVGATFAMGTANDTLYAQWTLISTYTVTYNGNGNTGGTIPIPADTAHYTLGQSDTTRANNGLLVKTGFTFVGWNTAANGSGISYATGIAFMMGSANVILYAQWSANPTYTVTYDGNGNAGGTVPTDSNNYLTGASVKVATNSGNLAKAGFAFVGWNTRTNGKGTSYATGVTFAMASANVILYAQWSANPTYTVTYNGNAPSYTGSVPIDANSYLTSAIVTAMNPGSLARAGYAFAGWNTQADGSGTTYAVGATFTIASGNVILYAKWIAIFTVGYDGNGSSGGSVPTDPNTYTTGSTVIVLGNNGLLVKTGYTFAGWSTLPGAGISYAVGAIFTMGTSNVTFYAKWTVNQYTVNFNSQGGSAVASQSVNYGSTATAPASPTLTGYTFAGWYADAGGTTAWNFATTLVTGNVTIYAKWSINQYTVTFNSNGGSAVASQSVNYGSAATTPASPTLTGYTFAGWYADAGYATVWNFATNLITGNVTIYAKWTINQYTVTFNSNGGSAVASQSVNYGSAATTPASPTLAGHVFAGWYADSGLLTAWNFSTNLITGNVTIYAKWTVNQYTVTFNSNGGSVVASQSVNYGSTATAPASPTLTGFTFAGWYADSGLLTAWNFSTTLVTTNVTIYAKWTINQYTVTFNSNGGSAVSSQSVNYGSTATAPASPTLTGYTFAGWYADSGLLTAWNFSTTLVTTNVTIYAKWTINQYTVTFNSQGGSAVASQIVNYGSTATAPASPTLSGFAFVGWTADQLGTIPWNFSTGLVTGDMTLYAQWN
jgi:uncharacterized repeat protein (TIGR02543 family)